MLSTGFFESAVAVAPTRSAASELKSVLAAGNGQESVHWLSIGSLGSKRVVISTDAGRLSGIQRITFTSNGSTGHVTVELVGGVLYIRGDAMTLEGYMGLKQSEASKVANQWISMRSNVPDYQAVVEGLTISTTISELNMTGPITYGSEQTVDGKSTIVIHGKTFANVGNTGAPSMPQTLYVESHGQPLPVKAIDNYQGSVGTIDFSDWGEVIKVAAPGGSPLLSRHPGCSKPLRRADVNNPTGELKIGFHSDHLVID